MHAIFLVKSSRENRTKLLLFVCLRRLPIPPFPESMNTYTLFLDGVVYLSVQI